jgi:parallel beta-helix repeat protein
MRLKNPPLHLISLLAIGSLVSMWADSTAVRSLLPVSLDAQTVPVLHVPRDFATIQAAVDAASEGATIQVKRGIYHEKVVITTPNLRLHASGGAVLDGTGAGGIGIHVLGTAGEPVTGVEISGFVVRYYTQGIVLQWAAQARVHLNEIHDIRLAILPAAPFDGRGIVLENTRDSRVTQNFVHDNGVSGITLWTGSIENLVSGNRIHENGGDLANFGGVGIAVTGEGTRDNHLRQNEVLRNHGWGIRIVRPTGTNPVTGTVVAQNRAHENQRSGIAIMFAAADNFVLQNDARGNNLSGLPPCYDCNLVELSTPEGNVWERNLGTFNLRDICMPQ